MSRQQTSTRRPSNTGGMSLTDYEKLRFDREEVKHEFNRLGMRSTMPVVCSAFIMSIPLPGNRISLSR